MTDVYWYICASVERRGRIVTNYSLVIRNEHPVEWLVAHRLRERDRADASHFDLLFFCQVSEEIAEKAMEVLG